MPGERERLVRHLGRVTELEQLLGIGLGAFVGEFHRGLYFALDIILDLCERLVVDAAVLEPLLKVRQWILCSNVFQILV